jgi:hypothetical protein
MQQRQLLYLLLGAELIRMSAFLLTAVDRTGRESSVALTTDHLVAVVLTRQHLKRRLNNTTPQAEDKVTVAAAFVQGISTNGPTNMDYIYGYCRTASEVFLVLNRREAVEVNC